MRKGEAAMYFFTPRDRKYPNGNRPNRAAVGGFWKATASKHAIVDENNLIIGYKSALVYHRGTPKESTKTDWLMQEYTLVPDNTAANIPSSSSSTNMKLNTFVLCKIYRKSTKLKEPSTSTAAPPLETTSPQTPPVLPLQQTNYHHQYEQMLPVLPLQANDHHEQMPLELPLQAVNDHQYEQMLPVLPLQTNDHHEQMPLELDHQYEQMLPVLPLQVNDHHEQMPLELPLQAINDHQYEQKLPVLPLQANDHHEQMPLELPLQAINDQHGQMSPVLPLQAINDHHEQTPPVLPLQATNDHHEQPPPVLPLKTNDHHEHHSQLPYNVGFSFHDDRDDNFWFGDNLWDFSYDPLVDSLLNDINLPSIQLSNNDSLLKDDNLPNPLPSFGENDFDLPPSQLLSDNNNFLPQDDTTCAKHGRQLPTPAVEKGNMEEENGQGRMMVRPEEEEQQQSFPPGYRFCPSDRQLIVCYLRKKVYNQTLPKIDDIYDVEINKYTPLQLFDNYWRAGEAAMYFFTSRDRKYLKGKRPNRAVVGGFWKATASKQAIGDENNLIIGYKSALVYHRGTFKNSTKTDWLMQEYTLPDNTLANIPSTSSSTNMKLNTFVLCKIYRKSTKLFESMEPSTSSSAPPLQAPPMLLQANDHYEQMPPELPLQANDHHEQMPPELPLQAINDHHEQTPPVLPLQAINYHHEQPPPVLPLQTNDHHEHHSQLPYNVGFSFHDDRDNNFWFGDNLWDFSYDPLVDSLLNDINLPPLQLSNNDFLLKDDNLPNPLPSDYSSFRETDFDLQPSDQLLSDPNNFLHKDHTTCSKQR
ncbi:hypothetical protein LWI28_020180 [Acer negundo]|uniref:NAC domain-containing protein n=1 Tax=Acer negundo TaxID=4023 RepID=A0AAD5IJF6_ACENE|nr:hypothetical protein LWI28_020180 [Acer negundo]